jgi:hypothetical protein
MQIMQPANLDALIPREDFEIKEVIAQSQSIQAIQIRDLERDSFLYYQLRKPDFQRETSEWDPKRISDFIQSFLSGDLIPAIILWNSGPYIFTIDGAHRLSALIAWVLDDYGDGILSQSFFGSGIPDEQREVAQTTRNLVKKLVGTYTDHKYAIQNQTKVPKEILERAKKLASLAIQVQWVNGDVKKAEASFFKINQQAVPVHKTELRLLKSRSKASALAARAIMRSGTGHKYWSRFEEKNQQKIEEIAKEIHNIIFTPKLETPIKTLDLPVAGPGYSSETLTLILDIINLINDVKSEDKLNIDSTGEETIEFLMNTRKIVQIISGNHPSSLGLHPAVYFYSPQGRYQSTSLLAVVQLVKDFQRRKYFDTFIHTRRDFEGFIIKYKDFVQQINNKARIGMRGYKPIKELYQFVIEAFEKGCDEGDILKSLKADCRFSYLKTDNIYTSETEKREFSRETKSEAFLKEALKNPIRCKICGGLIHRNSITVDHIERKEDGGSGIIDNAQIAHPYCNTTYKN